MPVWAIVLIVVIVLSVILAGAAISAKNAFVVLYNKVEEAFSTMDVYLKKRWDLIPNIVETVKGYSKHEKETLTEIVELRKADYGKMSMAEKVEANNKFQEGITHFFALAENYPELKASENYRQLSEQLHSCEEDIANARKYYNACSRDYNNKVQMFPSCIFAAIFGYKKQQLFSISQGERENVKVKF